MSYWDKMAEDSITINYGKVNVGVETTEKEGKQPLHEKFEIT